MKLQQCISFVCFGFVVVMFFVLVTDARPQEDKSDSKAEDNTESKVEDKYTTKYDNVNLDEILASERLLKAYYLCLLNQGKCTPDASELKRHLKEAIETNCEKCHDEQKTGTKKVLLFLIRNKPEMWSNLKALYDPSGEYEKKYLEEYKDQLNDKI